MAPCQSILGRLTYGTVGLVPMSWRLPTLPQLRMNRVGDPLRVITIKSVTHNPSSQPQRHSAGEVQLHDCARACLPCCDEHAPARCRCLRRAPRPFSLTVS